MYTFFYSQRDAQIQADRSTTPTAATVSQNNHSQRAAQMVHDRWPRPTATGTTPGHREAAGVPESAFCKVVMDG